MAVAVGFMGLEGRQLAVEAQDGGGDQGFFREIGGVVDQEPGFEIVGSVGDQIVLRHEVERVFRRDAFEMGDQGDVRVNGGQGRLGTFHLGCADRRRLMDDLALQVGQVDRIVVDHADGADPGGGQVQQHGRSKPPGADDQNPARQQLGLADAADLFQQDVPGVAVDLILGKIREIHGSAYSPRPANRSVER